MSIYEKRLQEDMKQIRDGVVSMGQQVEIAIKNAVQAVLTGNENLANLTILRDYRINRQCVAIDKLCHGFIARHLPSAGHLRLVSSVLRIIYELERLGDYAVTISRELLDMSHAPEGLLLRELEVMAGSSISLLQMALTAFVEENPGLARTTKEMTAKTAREMGHAVSELIAEGDAHAGHSRMLFDLYAIFYVLERVSRRSANLCEEVLFWLTGETKSEEKIKVLFIDESNTTLSLMAEALANRSYGTHCEFQSAGRLSGTTSAMAPDPRMVTFMRQVGIDLGKVVPRSIKGLDLANFDVVISLQGSVRAYVDSLPFRTSYLDWDVGELSEGVNAAEDKLRFEEIYREISVQIRNLVELTAGEEGG